MSALLESGRSRHRYGISRYDPSPLVSIERVERERAA
jgi:hypothetical protein